jgi:pimeloyl-ACP methyl ester carboxylesterase
VTSRLEHHRVPVEGGELFVGVWPAPDASAPVVVAVHGGTSSHRIWYRIASALGGRVTLIAPDFRGANGSESVGPPFGLRAHADDVRRIADHFGAARVILAGWSLGGFIAANAAALLRDRAIAAVLIDGGLPLPLPDGFDPVAMQDVLIEPAMKRYRRRFASRDEHRAVWRAHPSLSDASLWSDELVDAIDDELEIEPSDGQSRLRFRVNLDSLRADVLDTLRGDTRTAVERIEAPTTFVWAERGLEDEPVGYYPLEALREYARARNLRIAPGHGLNHYTLMLSDRGAGLVAAELARFG